MARLKTGHVLGGWCCGVYGDVLLKTMDEKKIRDILLLLLLLPQEC